MEVKFDFDNCDFDNRWLFEGEANSSITMQIELKELISLQSKKERRELLTEKLHLELNRFNWVALGPVYLQLDWYIDGVFRQETDRVGDLDNLIKPMIDALLGMSGLFIDDSQIKSLDTAWMTKNREIDPSILKVKIRFINDYALPKKDLYFIQYSGPMCYAVNISSRIDRLHAAAIRKARWGMRNVAALAKRLGRDMDDYYLVDPMDFHRSRLGHIPTNRMLDYRK